MTDWEQAPEPRERAGGRVVVVMLLGLALVLGGGYAAAYAKAGAKVPRGTTVAGVEIGGLMPSAATARLEEALGGRAKRPLLVEIGSQTSVIDPVEAGLGVDYAASVEAAGGGQSWQPARLWDYYTGGDDLDAVLDVDDTALTAAIAALGEDRRSGRRSTAASPSRATRS